MKIYGNDFLSDLVRNTTAETFLRTEEKQQIKFKHYFLNFLLSE
ncbi:MAG: hypothetical protein R2942_04190 [Ignavibacteria bacterium]